MSNGGNRVFTGESFIKRISISKTESASSLDNVVLSVLKFGEPFPDVCSCGQRDIAGGAGLAEEVRFKKNSRRDESRRLNPMNHQPKMFLAACRLP
ncbi:MAG TPA: hypothetical protein VL863_01155 [bacterium]|nr:hypothetical protein [bacterium]